MGGDLIFHIVVPECLPLFLSVATLKSVLIRYKGSTCSILRWEWDGEEKYILNSLFTGKSCYCFGHFLDFVLSFLYSDGIYLEDDTYVLG